MSGSKPLQMVVMCNDSVEAVIPFGTSQKDAEETLVHLKMEDKRRYMQLQGLASAEEAGRTYDNTRYWRIKEAPIALAEKRRLIDHIFVRFPCLVEISNEWQDNLLNLLNEVANHHNRIHPAQVMWLFGMGDASSIDVIRSAEMGEPLPSNPGAMHIEFLSRDRYEVTEAPTLNTVKAKLKAIMEQILPVEDPLNHAKAAERWDAEDRLLEAFYEAYAIGRIDGRGEDVARAMARAIMRETSANTPPGTLPIGIHLALAMLLDRLPGKKVTITHAEMAAAMDSIHKINTVNDSTDHSIVLTLEKQTEEDPETPAEG